MISDVKNSKGSEKRRSGNLVPAAVIELFGKNEQVKKVFWTLFIAVAGLVLARVADPVTAQQIVGIITAAGL